MRMISRAILALTIVVLASCGVEKKASKAFELAQFQASIDAYSTILSKDPNNGEANFFVAESYRQSNRIRESLPYYEKAIVNGIKNDSLSLHYALALMANNKYDLAKKELEKAMAVEDEQYLKRAEYEYTNLDEIEQIKKKKNYYRVKNLEAVNSESAEYSPVYNDGELYFASSRGNGKIYLGTGTPFTDIYKAKTKAARVDAETIAPLNDIINGPITNEGSVTFSPDGKTMVFAKGNSGKRKGTAEVNLYISRNRNGVWTQPRMLNINNPGYWDSSPAFSRDGKRLYFASNRPGGEGGVDIYQARRNSRGRFFKVQNLGPEINTPGNDLFPYVSDDGHLYFSSDGRPGFGGLDLFVARRVNGQTEIENLGQPINSGADDFGIHLFKADRGFFTSNRDGGQGDDDIYTFVNEDPDLKIVNYFLEGVTMTHDENEKLRILPNVDVKLLDYEGEIIDETTTREDGKFVFRVYEHEHYNLVGEHLGGGEAQYLITREEFTTVGKAADRDTLKQLVTEVRFDTVLVLERIEKDKVFVLDNIYYDLDKWDIREDAALELDKLVTILADNPELKIELSSHTDDRQTDAYNLRLSDRRARSAVNYIISQGISGDRLVAKGYGESKLLIANAKTEEEHQVNRRTEFKILALGEKKVPSSDEFDEDKYFDDEEEDSGQR
ncbi:MAG: OmpA family protein [Bacteroidota bacterium]